MQIYSRLPLVPDTKAEFAFVDDLVDRYILLIKNLLVHFFPGETTIFSVNKNTKRS